MSYKKNYVRPRPSYEVVFLRNTFLIKLIAKICILIKLTVIFSPFTDMDPVAVVNN